MSEKKIKLIKIFKNFIWGLLPAGILTLLPLSEPIEVVLIGAGVAALGLIEFWAKNNGD